MEILNILAALVGLVIVGTLLNNIFPKIPASLFQIVLGILFAFLPISDKFHFDPATFIALVVAPLLFTDAYNISRSKFWLYKKPILLMAIGLVLITVLIVGFIIHLLLPDIPVSAAFALAAILSPTDAIAVKSVTKGMKLPKGLMDILEGESLLNDAAGLVSFNIAIAAVLSGTFSIAGATHSFFKVALGGAILGAALGVILVKIKEMLGRFSKNESSTLVIFQLITPVIVYLIAEHTFHVSGIVAVVMTALVYNLEKDIFQRENINSEPALLIANNQTTIAFILNGFVFVFLGYLLPDIFNSVLSNPQINIYLVILYIIIITVAMMLVRFLFVYIFYIQFPRHSFSSIQRLTQSIAERKLDIGNYNRFEYALITSLSGIHGTITIATALMIPLTIASSGHDFPLRSTLLFIAGSVVMASIIIGTLFLPLVVKDSQQESKEFSAEEIRSQAILESIKILEKNKKPYTVIASANTDDTSAKEQIAYAMIIKKLYEQAIFYTDEIEYKLVQEKFLELYKEIEKKEKEKLKEFKDQGKYSELLITIQEIRHLRRAKLVTYNILKQIIIQIRLARKEGRMKSIIRLETFKSRLKNRDLNLVTQAITDQFKDYRNITNEFDSVSENIIADLDDNYPDILKNMVNTIFSNFKNVLFIRFINEPESYRHSYEDMWVLAISIQKEIIMKMRNSRQISFEEADIIFKEINYAEALLFTHE
ncbi:sodium:proton antiporter [Gemella sp. 19428wG2_WT2a]|nr:sodium:proton antiporter [Gemella sp. 19428wG2_WT2a]TFU58836.1 sodium:proton antiporter [Gemella sp. WT2a]